MLGLVCYSSRLIYVLAKLCVHYVIVNFSELKVRASITCSPRKHVFLEATGHSSCISYNVGPIRATFMLNF